MSNAPNDLMMNMLAKMFGLSSDELKDAMNTMKETVIGLGAAMERIDSRLEAIELKLSPKENHNE